MSKNKIIFIAFFVIFTTLSYLGSFSSNNEGYYIFYMYPGYILAGILSIPLYLFGSWGGVLAWSILSFPMNGLVWASIAYIIFVVRPKFKVERIQKTKRK